MGPGFRGGPPCPGPKFEKRFSWIKSKIIMVSFITIISITVKSFRFTGACWLWGKVQGYFFHNPAVALGGPVLYHFPHQYDMYSLDSKLYCSTRIMQNIHYSINKLKNNQTWKKNCLLVINDNISDKSKCYRYCICLK